MDKKSASQDNDVDTSAKEKIKNLDVDQIEWKSSSSSSEDNEEASSSDEDPFPVIPPRKRKNLDDLDEDYDPETDEDDELVLEKNEVAISAQNREDAPKSESSVLQKRKRGKRGVNKVKKGVIMSITHVSANGIPEKPHNIVSKFRNACGFFVRDEVPVTTPDWRKLPDDKIETLWKRVKESFIFPKGTEEAVKKATLINMGKKFRSWKHELNKNYVKQNKVPPPEKMGKITQAQWEEFVHQKTTRKAKALSEVMSEQAKKNIFPHHLGSSGYAPKIEMWEKIIADAIAAGTFDPLLQEVDERAIRWILARAGLSSDGKLLHPKMVDEVVKRIEEVVKKQKKGLFKPQRENDLLTAALGNPEHGGRVRGVSSQISLKEAFPQYRDSYKKHFKFNKTLEETIDEKVKKIVNEMLTQFKESGSFFHELQGSVHVAPPVVSSSTGSTQAEGSGMGFSIDNIDKDKLCYLHIPANRLATKTKQVATGIVKPKLHTYLGNRVPRTHVVVQVLKITDTSGENFELDYPVEGIRTVRDAVNELVLWHRPDIVLPD